jgi:hypothetical protein
MVAGDEDVPPYFLIADDYDRNGESNRYEFLLTGQRDNLLETADHVVTMRQIYRGPWFESGKADKDDAVAFEANVPADGNYYIWLYVKDHKARYRVDIEGQDVSGSAPSEASRWDCWQWQRLLAGERGEETPVTLKLSRGTHPLSMKHATERYGGNFARILLTPSADYEPWTPDAEDAPKGSVLVKAEQAESVGKAWIGHDALPDENKPQAAFAFLNPAPVIFEQSIYKYRTRHFGQVLNHLPQVTAIREAVNPRFLVFAYPHRADMEQPTIERAEKDGKLTAKIAWKNAVDTILWPADGKAALSVTRQRKDGTQSQIKLKE